MAGSVAIVKGPDNLFGDCPREEQRMAKLLVVPPSLHSEGGEGSLDIVWPSLLSFVGTFVGNFVDPEIGGCNFGGLRLFKH